MIPFKISTIQYYNKDNGTAVFRDATVLGYIFSNTGNCNVSLNNCVLPPGGVFKTFEIGFIDKTQWKILFISDPTSGCGDTYAELTVLIYSKE